MTNPAFELSIDTRIVYDALKKCGIGETITYIELSRELGREVHGATPFIQSALRKILNTDGIVFENVRGVGYQRLSDIDIINASERDTGSIRRKAKRSAKKLTLVQNFSDLPDEKKVEHNTRLSILSVISSATSRKSENQIADKVKERGGELPFAATLEAFKRT